jgi:uncharacterized membrane protein YdjX (TVP38/TMEM64 family)
MAESGAPTAMTLARRFGPLALLAAGLIAAVAAGLPGQLSLHELRHHHDQLEALARAHPVLAVVGYVAVYALAIGLSLPVAMVLTLTGGFLFGPWIGGFGAALGCTLGGTIVFLVCRNASGDVLRRRAGPTIARIEDEVLAGAFSYVMILRLLPIMPMALANLALGFIEIPLPTFVAATFLGILPISLIYADLGSDLGKLFDQGGHPNLHVLARPEVLLALIGLALLSLAPIVIRQLRRRRR